MDSLKALGFEKGEIETLSYNIYEDYTYNNNGRVLNGYKTSHQIKVSIEETDFIASFNTVLEGNYKQGTSKKRPAKKRVLSIYRKHTRASGTLHATVILPSCIFTSAVDP